MSITRLDQYLVSIVIDLRLIFLVAVFLWLAAMTIAIARHMPNVGASGQSVKEDK